MPKAKNLSDKLLLKPGTRVLAIHPPAALALPGAQLVAKPPAGAILVWAANKAELAKRVPGSVAEDARLWVCYPKAGKLGTDLSRDILWPLMEERGFEGVRLVALDDTWSAMAFRRKA